MLKNRIAAIALSTVCASVMSACGGNSGVSSGYPSAPATVGAPINPGGTGSATMGSLANLHTATYAVSGSVTADSLNGTAVQTNTYAVTNGKIVRTYTARPDVGANVYQESQTFTYTPQGGVQTAETTVRLLAQNSDGSLSLVGENKDGFQMAFAANSVPLEPGQYSAQAVNTQTNSNLVPTNLSPVTYYEVPTGGTAPVLIESYPGTAGFKTSYSVSGPTSVSVSGGGSIGAWKSQYTEVSSWQFNGDYAAHSSLLYAGFPVTVSVTTVSNANWIPSLALSVSSQVIVTEADQVSLSDSIAYTAGVPATSPGSAFNTYTLATLNKKETLQLSLVSYS